jgi:hypothetical protein
VKYQWKGCVPYWEATSATRLTRRKFNGVSTSQFLEEEKEEEIEAEEEEAAPRE